MPAPTQSSASFEEISQLIWKSLEDRDWLGSKPRSLATSIVLEAAELLEHYQWQDERSATSRRWPKSWPAYSSTPSSSPRNWTST